MQRIQTLPLLKIANAALTSTKQNAFRGTIFKTFELVAPILSAPPANKMIHTSSITPAAVKTVKTIKRPSIFSIFKEKLYYHLWHKYIFRNKGYYLYRDAVDSIDYIHYLKVYNMPDTFFSWFLITELHVWMLMARLMADGEGGKDMRKNLVEAMWQDAHMRKKQLGNVRDSAVQAHMNEMGHQFNAAVISYDEGLMTNDKVLAGAVWRRFLQSECNDAEVVEELVIYIRQTMNMLDKMPFEAFMKTKTLKWVKNR